jgi:hypothetical protein
VESAPPTQSTTEPSPNAIVLQDTLLTVVLVSLSPLLPLKTPFQLNLQIAKILMLSLLAKSDASATAAIT